MHQQTYKYTSTNSYVVFDEQHGEFLSHNSLGEQTTTLDVVNATKYGYKKAQEIAKLASEEYEASWEARPLTAKYTVGVSISN